MGSEIEQEQDTSLKLPLFSIPTMMSPEHSTGMQTPPHKSTASVPFQWEEEPGKPRPCTALITLPPPTGPKCLDLPPRLLMFDSKIAKTPSPTTVLDGPYLVGRSIFSSFRLRRDRQGSFDSSATSPENGTTVVPGKSIKHKAVRGFFSSWRQKPIKLKNDGDDDYDEQGGNSRVEMAKLARNESFSSLSSPAKSQLWAAVCEGLKQAITGKRKKYKKERFVF